MDISNAWGYGAVIIPKKLFWQAFIIPDPADPRFHKSITDAITAARVEGETLPPEGTLAASVVSCMINGIEFGIGVFAAALSETIQHRFWAIDAEVDDAGGTVTSVARLEVATPEAAREAIEKRVLPLKMGHMLKLMQASKGKNTGDPSDPKDDESRK